MSVELNKPRPGNGIPLLRMWVIIALFTAWIIAFFDRTNIAVLFADKGFTDALGISGNTSVQGLLMTVFMLAYGITNFFIGRFIQRFGPRVSLLLATAIWALLMALMGSVAILGLLLVGRVLLGIAESVMSPSSSKLIINWFPMQERVKANSGWFLGVLLAPAVAMPLLAWAVSTLGWRGSFYLLALLGLIPVIAVFLLVRDNPGNHQWISKGELEYITANIDKAGEPEGVKSDYSWAKDYRYWLMVFNYCTQIAVAWGVMTWLPSYLKLSLGFSWAKMGIFSSLPFLFGAISVILMGAIIDKMKAKTPFIVGGFLLTALFMYLGIGAGTPLAAALFISISLGALSPLTPALFAVLQSNVKPSGLAMATGVFSGVAYVYSSLTPYIMGWLHNLTGSFTGGFLFLICNALAGAVLTLPLLKHKF